MRNWGIEYWLATQFIKVNHSALTKWHYSAMHIVQWGLQWREKHRADILWRTFVWLFSTVRFHICLLNSSVSAMHTVQWRETARWHIVTDRPPGGGGTIRGITTAQSITRAPGYHPQWCNVAPCFHHTVVHCFNWWYQGNIHNAILACIRTPQCNIQ